MLWLIFLTNTLAEDLMDENVSTIKKDMELKDVAMLMMSDYVTHLPVVNEDNRLLGIVTAWDLSKSIALNCSSLDEIMTKNVITCKSDETIDQFQGK